MRDILSEHWCGGGGVVRNLGPRVDYRRSGLPDIDVCIQADLKAIICGQAGRVLETTFFGYRGV
jgi:hypothetical protein